MTKPFVVPEESDDGLELMEIHEYAERKYQLLGTYASIFADSMKNKWETRIYVDLFAGPGRSRIKETGRIVAASPCIALELDTPFDEYIFCEQDAASFDALKKRVEKDHGDKVVSFVRGDGNAHLHDIFAAMPRPSRQNKVLTFCFLDPYGFDNLSFETIRRFADRYLVDFLVLVPDAMSGNRNLDRFYESNSETPVDRFLGSRQWRDEFESQRAAGTRRDLIVSRAFTESMRGLGYNYGGVDESVAIKLPNNVNLYRLAFYSRNQLGGVFWKAAKKSSSTQRELEF